MMLEILAAVTLLLALLPTVLFLRNLRVYLAPPAPAADEAVTLPAVTVLIPARNEAANIRAALESVLASRTVAFEVVVLDDQSTDETARIVTEIAARDGRARLFTAPPLPIGWCGKPHACHILSQYARHPWLVFLDADVRLSPDALIRMMTFMQRSGADLASGIPRQETRTFFERLLIPLIHFLLLGFLPFRRMRASRHPSYGAGCGQLFIARAEAYHRAGGHAAIRATWHDGLNLPRAFRQAGFRTDLFDATEIATCRMYRNAHEVFAGLSKNAVEGFAAPRLIVPGSLLLVGGQLMPWLFLVSNSALTPVAIVLASLAAVCSLVPGFVAARKFRQSYLGAALHPFGVLVFLWIQWRALGASLLNQPAIWKGRSYESRSQVNLFPPATAVEMRRPFQKSR